MRKLIEPEMEIYFRMHKGETKIRVDIIGKHIVHGYCCSYHSHIIFLKVMKNCSEIIYSCTRPKGGSVNGSKEKISYPVFYLEKMKTSYLVMKATHHNLFIRVQQAILNSISEPLVCMSSAYL